MSVLCASHDPRVHARAFRLRVYVATRGVCSTSGILFAVMKSPLKHSQQVAVLQSELMEKCREDGAFSKLISEVEELLEHFHEVRLLPHKGSFPLSLVAADCRKDEWLLPAWAQLPQACEGPAGQNSDADDEEHRSTTW